LIPLLRLGREDEVDRIAGEEAERAVVVLRLPLPVAAGDRFAAGRGRFPDAVCLVGAGVRAVAEETALDRLLEGALGDVGGHGAPPLPSR
jgi:hypothetical protein